MTAETLKRFQLAHEAATEDAKNAREARNDAIRIALAENWTHAAISDVTGLSRGRIGQLAMQRPA
jgi:hypothetical protein